MTTDTVFVNFIGAWLLDHGIIILVSIIIAWSVLKFSEKPLAKIIRSIIPPDTFPSPEAEKQREDTLIQIITGLVKVLVWIVVIMIILVEFGVPMGPLLTGAGIAGIAVGFGAQYVVRDIVTGLFLIMENQFRIGDFVCINSVCGNVEQMTLRITKIRDNDGTVHFIPNGEIKMASNKSKEYSKVNFVIGVSYDSDLGKVAEVIDNVGQEMTENEKFGLMIMEAPKFIRVEDFGPSEVNVKIVGKVQPKKQWEVTGEMKRRLKLAFDKEGIEIPFPQQVVHYANGGPKKVDD